MWFPLYHFGAHTRNTHTAHGEARVSAQKRVIPWTDLLAAASEEREQQLSCHSSSDCIRASNGEVMFHLQIYFVSITFLVTARSET